VRSYAQYEGPLLRALLHLKYRPNRRLAAVFAGWLSDLLKREGWRVSNIVAVPLAASRLRQRGYNQAGLIAHALSRMIELPYDAGALRRIRETPSQVGLDPAERWLNVAGAFKARSHEQGHVVLIVDDLFTTGATLAACTSALLENGAEQVYGLTVARAR
jgi:ComF family protein